MVARPPAPGTAVWRRRVVALAVVGVLALVVAAGVAATRERRPPTTTTATPATTASGGTTGPAVQAWAAVVMDAQTGAVLYAKAADRHLPMASCTKVMTALLVLEHVQDLEAYAEVPDAAVGQPGAWIGLHRGDRITIRDLLLGLMVRSATDCAITLATYVSGSEPAFARLMNERAAELGLRDTRYNNASGIKVADHYTSARDLAELGRVAMRDARFRDLARRVDAVVTWPPDNRMALHSHNLLNRRFDWVDGIKTGASESAGCCLVASGTYRGRRLIVATLREPDRAQEVRDALALFAYGAAQPAKGR